MVWGTNVAEEGLLTAISVFLCCALRDSRLETRQTAASTVVIFVVAHSCLRGPESILLTNLLYLVHELFLLLEVFFSFLLTKMFYFFIRRLWNSLGTTKWYEQVINFCLRLALQSIVEILCIVICILEFFGELSCIQQLTLPVLFWCLTPRAWCRVFFSRFYHWSWIMQTLKQF